MSRASSGASRSSLRPTEQQYDTASSTHLLGSISRTSRAAPQPVPSTTRRGRPVRSGNDDAAAAVRKAGGEALLAQKLRTSAQQ